jgi:subtilisin family serine protease
VDASSRWEFQKPGIYLLEVALDIGRDTLISKSLAFRITPILLPLAPPPSLDGEGLYTVSQQPVNWGIPKINTPQAWNITHGSKDIIIAMIDSGVDFSIPQLALSMWVNEDEIPENGIDDDRNGYVDDIHGWDFRDNDNSSLIGTKLHWHGTFTASIIAAWPGDNAIVGIAPGVKIMDLRFAVDNGARIINLSVYANAKPPGVLEQALRRAMQHGVIIVGIAGNDGTAQVSYPGKYDFVIAVSATDRNDQLARFSNYGSEVTVTAPGDKITSLFPGGIAGTSSGTSFAAPHVTGALALILSVNPSMTADQALTILEGSAMDLGSQGRDRQFGYGLINVYNAVIRAGQ